MTIDRTFAEAGAPEKFSIRPAPAVVSRSRRGQTAIEYLLVTVSMLFVFVLMYKALNYSLANQFKRGGMVILKMYKEDPW